MVKKSTLLALLSALVLGAAVYYLDWKRGEKEKPDADTSKLAFSFQAKDISSVAVSHPGDSARPAVELAKRGDAWQITAPLQTEADKTSIGRILDGIASARISQTEPGAPDRLKVYGLDPPQKLLDFQLQNGAKHTIKLGNKDFTGISVYAVIDGGKDVALLPDSLLVAAGASLDDLRDRAVLHIGGDTVQSVEVKNASGEWAVARNKDEWNFAGPAGAPADSTKVNAVVGAVVTSRMQSIASEKSDNPAKYGFTNPAVTFTARDNKGQTLRLEVGKKDGKEYFARDTSRPTIFRVNETLYKELNQTRKDLRDKKLVHFESGDIARIEIHNSNGDIAFLRRKDDKSEQWLIDSPEAQKGKQAASWRFFSPIVNARAEEILDRPPAEVSALLRAPAIRVVLTTGDSRKLTLSFSKPSGGFVYARSTASPETYKLSSGIAADLDFKPADAVFER